MTTDEDRARLIAAITIAMQSTKLQTGSTFQQRLNVTQKAMHGSHWSITVGRDLKFGLLAWIDHPWHCYKLKRLVPQLLNQELSGGGEEEASKLLVRCCAMIEFGVDVNAQCYRRLREVVIDHNVSARELRSLLRHSTVWWGTSVTSTSGTNGASSFFRSIWGMGRPPDGELLLRQHHWLTQAVILTTLGLSGLAWGIVSFALLRYLFIHSTVFGAADLISASAIYGVVFCGIWWLGPGSWSAVSRLQKLLHSPPQEENG